MDNKLYRETSVKRITSPEQLNDYLKVTKPGVWVVLLAVAALLVGMLVWGFFINVDSFASGTAEVKNGTMTVSFEDAKAAKNVAEGMIIEVEGGSAVISKVETSDPDRILAVAATEMKDGTYPAKVCYKKTGLFGILFGS